MASAPNQLIFPVPLPAALELSSYPQFKPVSIPGSCGAASAYEGYIRPFSDDQTSRHVLRAFEASKPVQVTEGRIHLDTCGLPKHPFEDYLICMAVPCSLTVLDFAGTEHPRAYLNYPVMTPRLSQSPHLRIDKSLQVGGRLVPALCVYSSSLFKFDRNLDRMTQFLDQTATYLAKYLIWLRTRMLFRAMPDGSRQFVYRRIPSESVTNLDLIRASDVYWDGYWAGPSAPSGPLEHLATIRREDECWCWSGKRYEDCCRKSDLDRSRR